MTIYCTGLSSEVGKQLNSLNELNLKSHKTKTNRNSKEMIFENPKLILEDGDYLIHIAWNMDKRDKDSYNINVIGSKNLINSLDKEQMKRFIFISTINASNESKSIYEKDKFEVENYVLEKGGSVIKCGIFYSSEDKFKSSFVNSLYNTAKNFPVIPNFSGNRKIYYLTSDLDLKFAILKMLDKKNSSKINKCYGVGPITFKTLVNEFMELDKTILNIPWSIGYMVSKFFEILRLNFPIKSDSLLAIRKTSF